MVGKLFPTLKSRKVYVMLRQPVISNLKLIAKIEKKIFFLYSCLPNRIFHLAGNVINFIISSFFLIFLRFVTNKIFVK